MNEGANGLDQSYDHLLKGDQRKEESKITSLYGNLDDNFEANPDPNLDLEEDPGLGDNEELKEGFIGDLNDSYTKEKNIDEIEKFVLEGISNDRTRVKTAFQTRQAGTPLGEVNKSNESKIIEPMVNKLYEDPPEEQKEELNFEESATPQNPLLEVKPSNLDLELQYLVSENPEETQKQSEEPPAAEDEAEILA